jgi:hypothetical protein
VAGYQYTSQDGRYSDWIRARSWRRSAKRFDDLSFPFLTTSSKVPKLRRYQYALLANNNLLIINPEGRKVVDIITH